MKIKIPKRHSKYIDAILEVCKLKKEELLLNIFTLGMTDAIEDLEMGAGTFPPDMDASLLRGKEIELQIPYELSKDQNDAVELASYTLKRKHKFKPYLN